MSIQNTISGFEHLHIDYDFSLLDGFAVEEKEEDKAVDPMLFISEGYLKQLEEGRRIQSRTTDNYLRIFHELWHLDVTTGESGFQKIDRVTQRQRPQ